MNRRGLTFAVVGVLFANELFDCFAQYCFKVAASTAATGQPSGWTDAVAFLGIALRSGHLWLGLATLAVVFVSWLVVLSKIELSVAIPMTSFSYVFVAVTAAVFLQERISTLRWMGIAFILAGVAAVSTSSGQKEKPP